MQSKACYLRLFGTMSAFAGPRDIDVNSARSAFLTNRCKLTTSIGLSHGDWDLHGPDTGCPCFLTHQSFVSELLPYKKWIVTTRFRRSHSHTFGTNGVRHQNV